MLSEEQENGINKHIDDKLNTKNVIAVYYFSRQFNSLTVSNISFQFIKRCFPTIVDNTSFLDLDFRSVSKILSSSELNIDSELEVFNAVVAWIDYKKERSKHAKSLFMKIRLSLLSVPALNYVSDKISSFFNDCAFINKVLLEKNKTSHTKAVSRYCNQDKFSIILCGGINTDKKVVRDVFSFEANNFNNITSLPQLEEGRQWSKAACIKNEIFVLGGVNELIQSITSIVKYSVITNAWETIAHMFDKRIQFSVCSFMENIFVLGGYLNDSCLNCCSKFTPTDCSFRNIAEMTTARNLPSSAVFEGKIVVSGGSNNGSLNSVEAYDHIADAWTNMPNMIEGRWSHCSVAIKNKLYVVGGYKATFEVYDSYSEKFSSIKYPSFRFENYLANRVLAISFGSKLAFFNCLRNKCFSILFDIESEVWSEEPCGVIKNISRYSGAKLRHY